METIWYKVAEAAKILKMCPDTVYRRCAKGIMSHSRSEDGQIRLSQEDIDNAFKKSN